MFVVKKLNEGRNKVSGPHSWLPYSPTGSFGGPPRRLNPLVKVKDEHLVQLGLGELQGRGKTLGRSLRAESGSLWSAQFGHRTIAIKKSEGSNINTCPL